MPRLMWILSLLCLLNAPVLAAPQYPLEELLVRAKVVVIAEVTNLNGTDVTLRVVGRLRGDPGAESLTFTVIESDKPEKGKRYFVFSQGHDRWGDPKNEVKLSQGLKCQGSYCGWIMLPIEKANGEDIVKNAYSFKFRKPEEGISALTLAQAQELVRETSFKEGLDSELWHFVAKGQLASIHISRTPYERQGEKDFLICVRVTNLTDRPIGVELRDFWKVVYPNQVGFQDEKTRGDIDERRMIHKPLTDDEKAKLIADFKAGGLVTIPARGSTDYFRRFNAGKSLALAKEERGKFFFISLDGEQRLTDGTEAEQVSLEWEKASVRAKAGADAELFIPTPLKWEKVPPDGRIVTDMK